MPLVTYDLDGLANPLKLARVLRRPKWVCSNDLEIASVIRPDSSWERRDAIPIDGSRGEMRTNMRKSIGPPWVVLAAVLAAGGCEPATLTEARDQLGRNPGTVSFILPISDTTYLVSDLLAEAASRRHQG